VIRLAPASLFVIGVASLFASPARAAGAQVAGPALRLALLEPNEMPPPTETAGPPPSEPPPGAAAGKPAATAVREESVRPADLSYGVAARLRWATIPKWILNIFTKQSVPVSSWASALELYRRKGSFDFVFSAGYTNLTPPDGNWLGKANDPTTDTDYVQIRGLGFWGMDVSFVWHAWFNEWFGLHYGAGLGLAIVTGKVSRTSDFNDPAAGSTCTAATAGDVRQCHPIGVNPASATQTIDQQIQNLGPGLDTPMTPHRFDQPIPGALPLLNVVLGVDFRLPGVRGWEARLEGGFYDSFFLGGTVGYTF
jgi:hypothetical protein